MGPNGGGGGGGMNGLPNGMFGGKANSGGWYW